jgi:3-deoxy-D-manno-octulosonic-acid transferase
MYFIYSLLLTFGFLILLPRFLFDAFRHGKYVAGFRERLGHVPAVASAGRPVIWLHCVSVGETQAARPLVRAIRKAFPDYLLAVSTITLTGQRLAREVFKEDAARVFYFPFDWRWTVRRSLKAINPSLALLMETELWPGFLRECQIQRIPVALVNGRLSDESFRRYRLIRGFISQVVGCLDLAMMQGPADAERIGKLGVADDRVFISGSLKFDASPVGEEPALMRELRDRFNIGSDRLILAASTHAPEERILIEALQRLRNQFGVEKPRLMVAPRHPERFEEVASLLATSGLTWRRRTAPQTESDTNCDAILLDTIGELRAVYPLASVVFVGGSISKTGGHNILEPAAVGACMVTGAHTHNFEYIVQEFVQADAIVRLPPLSQADAPNEIAKTIGELLSDQRRRETLGNYAKHLVEKNRGATERTLGILTKIMKTSRASNEILDSPPVRERAHSA